MTDGRPNILLIVEGKRLEADFFRRWAMVEQRLAFEIYTFRTNISVLYRKMEKENFDCDIRGLLRRPDMSQEEKFILSQDYAETYLIFDCDLQHTDSPKQADEVPLLERAKTIIKNVQRMAEHLNNETDPTRGKLYVNYPMMESYRDANSFDEDACPDGLIPLADVPRYKQYVGTRHLCSVHLDVYTSKNFESLVWMNLNRLASLSGTSALLDTYGLFRKHSSQVQLATLQSEKLCEERALVLNTSLFFPLDYFGEEYFQKVTQRVVCS